MSPNRKKVVPKATAYCERVKKRFPEIMESTKPDATRGDKTDEAVTEFVPNNIKQFQRFLRINNVLELYIIFWDGSNFYDTRCGQVLTYIGDHPEEMKATGNPIDIYSNQSDRLYHLRRQALSLVQMWKEIKLALTKGKTVPRSDQRNVQAAFLSQKAQLSTLVKNASDVRLRDFSPFYKERKYEVDQGHDHLTVLLHLFTVLWTAESAADGEFRLPPNFDSSKKKIDTTQRHLRPGHGSPSPTQQNTGSLVIATVPTRSEQELLLFRDHQSSSQQRKNQENLNIYLAGKNMGSAASDNFYAKIEQCDLLPTQQCDFGSLSISQKGQQNLMSQRQPGNDDDHFLTLHNLDSLFSAPFVAGSRASEILPTQHGNIGSTNGIQNGEQNPLSQGQSKTDDSNDFLAPQNLGYVVSASFVAESGVNGLLPTHQGDFGNASGIQNEEQSSSALVLAHSRPPTQITVAWIPGAKVPWAKELLGFLKERGVVSDNLETKKKIKIWPSQTAEEVRDQIRSKFDMDNTLGAQIRTLVTVPGRMDVMLEDWSDVQEELWKEEHQAKGLRMTLRKLEDGEDIWEV